MKDLQAGQKIDTALLAHLIRARVVRNVETLPASAHDAVIRITRAIAYRVEEIEARKLQGRQHAMFERDVAAFRLVLRLLLRPECAAVVEEEAGRG